MIAVRVTTSTGETWTTSINATLDEARAHFMGYRFETLVPDRTSWAGVREKLMGPVVSVELIA